MTAADAAGGAGTRSDAVREGEASWTTPWVTLGFLPDAFPAALRAAAAFVLAYAAAFYAQVESASSAGVTVALIAQPALGMSFSKARYRVVGTLLGGMVSLLLLGLFPQDRTMLLIGYAAWLALCTTVGSLLRDFRSYGAVLSGYTVAIVAIGTIDAPAVALMTTLDRVAAVGIGIGAVLLVNTLSGSSRVLDGLERSLSRAQKDVFGHAADVLDGRAAPPGGTILKLAADLVALRSQTTFAGTELPDGRIRINGARHAVSGMLRAVVVIHMLEAAAVAEPAWRDRFASALRAPEQPDAAPVPENMAELVLMEGAAELAACRAQVARGLRTLSGEGNVLPFLRLPVSRDLTGAMLNAIRSTVALGLACSFVVLAGWPGATLLLAQCSSIIALLGASPNPTRAAMPFIYTLPPVMLAVGLAKFLLLPVATGFAPFAIVCLALMAPAAVLQRHPRTASFAPAVMLYVALFLGASNPQSFDLSGFLNTGMQLFSAAVFVVVAFRLILPVSPSRRLIRVAADILGEATGEPSVLFDRLARASTWLGRPRLTRGRLMDQLQTAGQALMLRRWAADLTGHPGLPAAATVGVQESGPLSPPLRRAAALQVGAELLEQREPGLDRLRRAVLGQGPTEQKLG